MYILNSFFGTCISYLFSQEYSLQYIKEAWEQDRAGWRSGGWGALFTIYPPPVTPTMHRIALILHWGVSLHEYVCGNNAARRSECDGIHGTCTPMDLQVARLLLRLSFWIVQQRCRSLFVQLFHRHRVSFSRKYQKYLHKVVKSNFIYLKMQATCIQFWGTCALLEYFYFELHFPHVCGKDCLFCFSLHQCNFQ